MPAQDQQRHGPATPPDGHIVVGKVVSPWGISGELKVESMTDVPGRLDKGSQVQLNGRPAIIVSSRQAKGLHIVELDTVPDRNTAETLHGALLTIPQDQTPRLPDGTFYHYEILGIDVRTEGGEPLGQVTEIMTTGGNDVYVVSGADSQDILLPAVKDVVLHIDVGKRQMVVRLIEGLR